MVSADNLNLDVLEHIFCFLSGNDLPSTALVSRSFLTAVIPRLYNTISYRLRQGKGYSVGETMSPFAAVVAHPHLAVHVHHIEIRAVPMVKQRVHPTFIRQCREALRISKNLRTFKCTVRGITSMFLPSLEDKTRLESMRIYANLESDQAKMLLSHEKLRSLTLEFASWHVVDVLPLWTQSMSKTLTTLTLHIINELHEAVLESALSQLPNLLGLHVIGCPKIDHVVVLRQVSHTPLLQSLSLTTSESTRPLDLPPPTLSHLRYLAFDTRYAMHPSPAPSILASLLTHIKSSAPALLSFALKLPERKVVVGEPFVTQLIELFGYSLRRIAFLDCAVSNKSLAEICKSCVHLERLDVAIPTKEIPPLVTSLEHSRTLHTLVDVDNHVDHGVRKSLDSLDVTHMFSKCPGLKKIVTTHRIWTGRTERNGDVNAKLERRSSRPHGSLWFMPLE